MRVLQLGPPHDLADDLEDARRSSTGIPIPIVRAERAIRSMCSSARNNPPSNTRMPSNTPSPYRKPWSKMETDASLTGLYSPLTYATSPVVSKLMYLS